VEYAFGSEIDYALLQKIDGSAPNHTLRMHVRRLMWLTNAFSKKLENFKAAISLHMAYYNFCKMHLAVRCTPAMAAGIEPSQWSVAELIERCGE
jgi:4'-phosphopantetheinyl transferase EntD